MILMPGCRSNRPENTSRAIATEVSKASRSTTTSRSATSARWVIRHAGIAGRVQPDRQVVRRHGREERRELGQVERPAGDVREDLHAARAEVPDGAVRLGNRGLGVASAPPPRSRGTAPGACAHSSAMASLATRASAVGRARRSPHRRVGKRDDLAVVAELVHLAEAGIEIEQFRDAAQPLADVLELRRDPCHLLEKAIGINVAVNVNQHACLPRLRLRVLEHDPERPAPHAIRGGYRFSEKIMLHEEPGADDESSRSGNL